MTVLKTREWTTRNKLGTVRLKASLKEQKLARGLSSFSFSLERVEPGKPASNSVIAENIRSHEEAERRFTSWCRTRTWEPAGRSRGPAE